MDIILEPKYFEPLERPEIPLTDRLKPVVVDMTSSGELKWTDVEPNVFQPAPKPEVPLTDALKPIVIDMTGRGNNAPSADDSENQLRPEVIDLTSPGQDDYSDDYSGLIFWLTLHKFSIQNYGSSVVHKLLKLQIFFLSHMQRITVQYIESMCAKK